MDINDINDDRQYRVELAGRVEILGQVFYPGHVVTLRGDILKQVMGSVKDAKPI